MAKYEITKIECPKCGKENSKHTWKNINIQTNPDLKNKVLNKELFKFKCINCGYEAQLDYSLIYEDDYKIYYVTTQEELDEVLDLLNSKEEMADTDSKICRVVCSQEDLFEKIHLFDLKLDDRIIEIIKVLFYMNFKKQNQVDIDAIYFDCIDNMYQLTFMNQGFEEGKVNFDMNLYNQIKDKYHSYLEEDVRIDFDYAASIIMKEQSQS